MPIIRPSSDLRNNYNEISTIKNELGNLEQINSNVTKIKNLSYYILKEI